MLPYVQTAVEGQAVLHAGWLPGHAADRAQVQVEPVLASALAVQPQTW